MRLDKLLAHTGYGTRKDVKDLLKRKKVTVDGKVIKKGNLHVDPKKQIIQVENTIVHYEEFMYLILHKPQNYVSATRDDRDKTVIDLVPEPFQHYDLFPVGRLDKDTEGLVLLTNDGMLNHLVTAPKNEIYKTYYATINGKVTPEHKEIFKDGVTLDDGYKTKAAHLDIIYSGDTSEITLSISEGKFHQVKRMFRAIDREVTYLKRLSIGELHLDSRLAKGKVRRLTEKEMAYIMSLKN